MIARLQRRLMLGGLLALTAWVALWWRFSPTVALAGIALALLGHASVVALELLACRVVSATDSVRPAHVWQCVRAWSAECRIAPRVFCLDQPFLADIEPDHLPRNGRRGVVLVHGFLCNRGFWNAWLTTLRSTDRAFVAVNLEPPMAPIDAHIRTIDRAVAQVFDATGLAPMIVCHSMGGLAARAWLQESDARRAHRIVTIGTPHGGTWLARFGRSPNTRAMRIGSDWLRHLQAGQAHETPVPFTCWYSTSDNVAFPASRAMLEGADNRCAGALGHVELAHDRDVQSETLALLDLEVPAILAGELPQTKSP
ncbi:MAG: permease [Gammaproteobacteria bacterium]|nr:permease [Gammaproteobacteria bacterium]MBU1440337.1 permease [Gammaproteobacteria bacterium]MBU2288639.1 permease [Gammaproteobacteria bacterium]